MGMNRKQIMETFIRIMKHISDKEYQTRIWIKGEGPEVDDFDETVCNFFQEGDGIIEKHEEFGLTENQYQILRQFRDQFKAFSGQNDLPEEFIDTPEWKSVMEMAKKVVKAFDFPKK